MNRAIVHLVAGADFSVRSVCGSIACNAHAGGGHARGTVRRSECTCLACLAAILPGSYGGTANDPDSIDVERTRNAVHHYTRELVEPRTITRA